jgi:hypothetical protein
LQAGRARAFRDATAFEWRTNATDGLSGLSRLSGLSGSSGLFRLSRLFGLSGLSSKILDEAGNDSAGFLCLCIN